jgi:AraC-like DNA-binding protein
LVSGGLPNRFGRLRLVGEIIDAAPTPLPMMRVVESYVLTVVVDGRGTYRYADRREAALGPGVPTVIPPGVPHWYGPLPGGRWTELFAVFDGPLFDTLSDVGVLSDAGPRPPRPGSAVASLRMLLRTPPHSARAAEHQLLALADWLVDTGAPQQESSLSPHIAVAVERLGSDLGATLDMEALASDLGLSYDAFRRRFRSEVGQPPGAYRSSRRLEVAAAMLRATEMTTRQIASALGFTDEFHFSRRFRAHFGQPPRNYRRDCQ